MEGDEQIKTRFQRATRENCHVASRHAGQAGRRLSSGHYFGCYIFLFV